MTAAHRRTRGVPSQRSPEPAGGAPVAVPANSPEALPPAPPPELHRLARHAFATDQGASGIPTFTAGEDPWAGVARVVDLVWRAVQTLQRGEALPDPAKLPVLRRCTTCAALLRTVRREDDPTQEVTVHTVRNLDGLVALVPTPRGMRARVYPDKVAAQVAGGPRWHLHWPDCSNRAAPKPTTKKTASRKGATP